MLLNAQGRFAAVFLLFSTATCAAVEIPFIEDFATGTSNWVDNSGNFGLDLVPKGGPDGGQHVSDEYSFVDFEKDDNPPSIFRANDQFNASGDAFVGDWIAEGVTRFSFDFRHNLPVPVNVFSRFAGSINFPGAIAVKFQPVFANRWTNVTFDIDPNNPEIVSFEGMTFEDVFTAVGNLQIGIEAPDGFAGNPAVFRFDLDNVSIVPEPTGLGVWLLAGLAAALRRHRWRSVEAEAKSMD